MAVVNMRPGARWNLIEGGGAIAQETRLYEPDKDVKTRRDAHDYHYFPDPDLLQFELEDEASFTEVRGLRLPRTPSTKRKRYEGARGSTPYDASVLTAEVENRALVRCFARRRAAGDPSRPGTSGRRRNCSERSTGAATMARAR